MKGKGLEIPCVYTFSGTQKLVKKLESLLQKSHMSCIYSYPCLLFRHTLFSATVINKIKTATAI